MQARSTNRLSDRRLAAALSGVRRTRRHHAALSAAHSSLRTGILACLPVPSAVSSLPSYSCLENRLVTCAPDAGCIPPQALLLVTVVVGMSYGLAFGTSYQIATKYTSASTVALTTGTQQPPVLGPSPAQPACASADVRASRRHRLCELGAHRPPVGLGAQTGHVLYRAGVRGTVPVSRACRDGGLRACKRMCRPALRRLHGARQSMMRRQRPHSAGRRQSSHGSEVFETRSTEH